MLCWIALKIIPEFDFVTLFHTGEFRTEKNDEYGALTDLAVAELLLGKLRAGGRMLFFSGSFAYDKAEAVAAELVGRKLIQAEPDYKTLKIYRKVTS